MIILKSSVEIAKMKQAGEIVASVIKKIFKVAKKDIKTIDLNEFAKEIINKSGASSAFLGYRGYPKSICISLNEQVVHGIPSNRKLKDGELLSIDVGVSCEGYYADAAATIAIGEVLEENKTLLDIGKLALDNAIEKCKEGNRLSDISYEIQKTAENNSFSVVKEYVGHGIGQKMHEEPQVPNFGDPGKGPLLKKGMVLALEPMINAGSSDVEVLEDGWTVVTKDRKPSVHFEHTVAITNKGPQVLTQV